MLVAHRSHGDAKRSAEAAWNWLKLKELMSYALNHRVVADYEAFAKHHEGKMVADNGGEHGFPLAAIAKRYADDFIADLCADEVNQDFLLPRLFKEWREATTWPGGR